MSKTFDERDEIWDLPRHVCQEAVAQDGHQTTLGFVVGPEFCRVHQEGPGHVGPKASRVRYGWRWIPRTCFGVHFTQKTFGIQTSWKLLNYKTSDQMSQIAPKHISYTSFYTPSTKLQNFWSFLWAPISDPTVPAQNPRNPSCAQTREATSRMVTFAPTCVLSYRCINMCCENKTCIKRFGSRAVLFGAGYFLVIWCCLSLLRRSLVAHQRLHGRSNSQPRNV